MLLLLVIALSKRSRFSVWLTTLLLLSEVLLVNAVLAVNGGASNPFGVVLLIPIVLAFMLLPLAVAVAVLMVTIALQSAQLLMLSGSGHAGHAMLGHYHGMILGFVFTGLLIGVVIRYFRWQLASREQQIQRMRERQLRDEQLLAIGTAAAQLTHDVATPAQTIRLLLEEAGESPSPPAWVEQLNAEFGRIESHLHTWRTLADDIREKRTFAYSPDTLWQALQKTLHTARPEARISWHCNTLPDASVHADRTLLPAISSIVINACEATHRLASHPVEVTSNATGHGWQLAIANACDVIDDAMLEQLGAQFMTSSTGHGVGAVISNATIERFGGSVTWQRNGQILVTLITLPVSPS
ncbi:sensor histidine kinase [Alteromonas halophila]|uniref:histidine kinase n=1 Tax=Alteromonas halophila TaxID=516698 RepID=A0A918JRZ2_9ALTE|nr:HAMP domain-containing histidine kinase [Alteromonas halophila]GGW93461.1 hypothetical protein GCM10007391_29790 [Alteromonas halophila]